MADGAQTFDLQGRRVLDADGRRLLANAAAACPDCACSEGDCTCIEAGGMQFSPGTTAGDVSFSQSYEEFYTGAFSSDGGAVESNWRGHFQISRTLSVTGPLTWCGPACPGSDNPFTGAARWCGTGTVHETWSWSRKGVTFTTDGPPDGTPIDDSASDDVTYAVNVIVSLFKNPSTGEILGTVNFAIEAGADVICGALTTTLGGAESVAISFKGGCDGMSGGCSGSTHFTRDAIRSGKFLGAEAVIGGPAYGEDGTSSYDSSAGFTVDGNTCDCTPAPKRRYRRWKVTLGCCPTSAAPFPPFNTYSDVTLEWERCLTDAETYGWTVAASCKECVSDGPSGGECGRTFFLVEDVGSCDDPAPPLTPPTPPTVTCFDDDGCGNTGLHGCPQQCDCADIAAFCFYTYQQTYNSNADRGPVGWGYDGSGGDYHPPEPTGPGVCSFSDLSHGWALVGDDGDGVLTYQAVFQGPTCTADSDCPPGDVALGDVPDPDFTP